MAFGTLSCCIRYANPSTMAVLPIPALPIRSADLSGVNKTRINFLISSSRAIAGFVMYFFAVKSSPYAFNTLNFSFSSFTSNSSTSSILFLHYFVI